MRFLRLASVATAALAVCFVVVSKPAHADPHAVFYTAIGQQQLFFNVLAALDQADYVEPKEGEGALSRQALLQARDDAAKKLQQEQGVENPTGYPPESFPVLESTKTDLSSVLSRGITLEGQDLWTSYLLHQAALEQERRAHLNGLINILCNTGEGRCNGDRNPADTFVIDPLRFAFNSVVKGGISALLSNRDPNSASQAELQGEVQNAIKDVRPQPIAFDEGVAGLRENTAGNTDKASVVEGVANSVAHDYQGSGVNSHALDDIKIDPQTGQPSFTFSPTDSKASVGRQIATLNNVLTLPLTMQDAAARGVASVATQQAGEVNDNGSLADTYPVFVPGTGDTPHIAGVGIQNSASPGDVDAAKQAALTGLTTADSFNQHTSVDRNRQENPSLGCGNVENKDGVCITVQGPMCFTQGQPYTVKFTIKNKAGDTKIGITRIYPVYSGQETGPLEKITYSPTPTGLWGGGREWRRQSIGEQSYTVSGNVRSEQDAGFIEAIHYRATFTYGGRNPKTTAFISDSVNAAKGACETSLSASAPGSSAVAGATTRTNGQVAGDTSNTPSGSSGNQFINPIDAYPPNYQDSEAARELLGAGWHGTHVPVPQSQQSGNANGSPMTSAAISSYFNNP